MTYELDFLNDEILSQNAFGDFQESAVNVDKAMNQWKEEYDKIS